MEAILNRIIVDSNVLDGKPCICGKRISVQPILELLSAGNKREDILYQYFSLEEKNIEACLLYATKIAGLHHHIHPIQQHA